MGRRLFISLLVGRDVLMVLQLFNLEGSRFFFFRNMNIAVSDLYVAILDLKWTDGAVALLYSRQD